jgi:hypothetical protein
MLSGRRFVKPPMASALGSFTFLKGDQGRVDGRSE